MSICAFAHCKNTQDKCPGIRFYKLPSLKNGEKCRKTKRLLQVLQQRRSAWLNVINKKKSTKNNDLYVCSLHFVNGAPSSDLDVKNLDWSPTLNITPAVSKKTKEKRTKIVSSPARSSKTSPARSSNSSSAKGMNVKNVCSGDELVGSTPRSTSEERSTSISENYDCCRDYPLSFMRSEKPENEGKYVTVFEMLCGSKLPEVKDKNAEN